MGRACSTNRREEENIQDIGRDTRRKKPLGRPRRKWADNIKMYLRTRWYGLDRSGSGYGPVEGHCEQAVLATPQKGLIFMKVCYKFGFVHFGPRRP
jgi:hypothetical protein